LSALIGNQQFAYVVVNVGVNLVFLVRSYVTMRSLGYADLGLVALMQAVMLLIGTLQFGFINGGYRLLCEPSAADAARINNLLYSVFSVIALVAGLTAALSASLLDGRGAIAVAVLGVLGGLATLARTWIANQLIARGELARLNAVTLRSAILSLGVLALIPWSPLTACIGSLAVQPIAFVAEVLIRDRAARPYALNFDRALVARVLAAGFVPFLTGLLVQFNQLIERWYVAGALGVAALGHLYLVLLCVTLFQLVPTSLEAVFLPRLVRTHAARDDAQLRRVLRQMFGIELAYCALACGAVLFAAHPVLALVLPKYVGDLVYVYAVLPGLIAITLAAPLAMTFNILLRYRSFLVAYGSASLLVAVVFTVAWIGWLPLTLDGVVVLRSAALVWTAVALGLGYLVVCRSAPEFRMLGKLSAAGRGIDAHRGRGA
jgi:O-antigen/teichoic acid export membrane protein